MIEAGQKVAIIGANGVGKTTLLRMLAGDLASDTGSVKWSDSAALGYMTPDVSEQFHTEQNLFDWLGDYRHAGADDNACSEERRVGEDCDSECRYRGLSGL